MNNLEIKKKIFKTKDNYLLPIFYVKKKNIKKKKIIIVIEEIFGVNKNIKNIYINIAKKNYIVIAPELLSRIKNINFNQNIKKLRKTINSIPDKYFLYDLNQIIISFKKKYKTNKIGITGFSWGGRITWLLSYFYNQNIKTSVIWYGKLKNKKNNNQLINPIDIINKIKIPTLGLYEDKDKIIPINIVKKTIKKIKKKKKKIKIIIYKNSNHRFFENNKKISKKALKKMFDWFNKYIN